MRVWLPKLALGLLLLIVATSPACGQFFLFENPLLGEKAPEFTLDTTKESKVSLTKYRAGDPAIIFFWATWCPHCREQLDELHDKAEELKAKRIRVLLVDLGEDKGTVEDYLAKKKMSLEIFLDTESTVAEDYGVVGVPTLYFLDQDGVVQAVDHMLLEDYEDILKGKKKG